MNSLLQTICRIGIFMICAQAVVHFRPQASYEKYLKLLVGAMVLIQLFLPVSRFLFRGDGGDLEQQAQAFLEGLEEEMAAAEIRAYETDALLQQMTLEEIRRRAEEAAGGGVTGDGIGTGDSGGTGNGIGMGESIGTGESRTGDSIGTGDAGADNDTIRIDRIQVEEILVQPETGSAE